MLRNYLKTTIRNLWRNKIFSIINIIGLAIGLAGSFFLLMYASKEAGYNKCHEKRHDVYRILEHKAEFEMSQPNTPFLMSENLKATIPEVKTSARLSYLNFTAFQKDETFIDERRVYACDPAVFDIFTLPVIDGNKDNFLREPASVVLTEDIAVKYFGDEDPIGREITLRMNEKIYTLRVDGIIENVPQKSTFRPNVLCHIEMKWELYQKYFSERSTFLKWSLGTCRTYVLLPEGYDPEVMESKFPDFIDKHIPENVNVEYSLQCLTDIYFHSSHLMNSARLGSLQRLYNFSMVAILILFIACANYVILSTAQSLKRAKEIGIRKVVGAHRSQLIKQILTESIVVCMLAFPFALVIMELSASFVNELLNTNIEIWISSNLSFLLVFIIITLLVGIMSGGYLSFYLSRLNPVLIFRLKADSYSSRSLLRPVLIIMQLVIFSALIIIANTISLQVNYARNTDLGFDTRNIISFRVEDDFIPMIPEFLNEIKSNPDIINACAASYVPPFRGWSKTRYPHPTDPRKKVVVEQISVDYTFIETLGLELVQGRNFSREHGLDKEKAIILTEYAVEKFGFEEAVGSVLKVNDTTNYHIIGVVKDLHMRSLKDEITPMVIKFSDQYLWEIAVRHRIGTYRETAGFIEEKMSEFDAEPSSLFSLEENVKYLYREESSLMRTFNTFTILASFISILGLFALSLFMVRQKQKNIGIRKIFGASIKDIFRLVLSEFLLMIIIANVIAFPLGWFFTNRWLEDFAYRISFPYQAYIFALLASVLLVLLTVGINIFKVARSNPVESIQYE